MKISVICVVFNREKTIERALLSIKNQSLADVECVVVDGSSTDKTVEVIKSIMDPSDILISEPDGGAYDALNKGLSRATGDVIALLHSDDVYANNEVLKLVADAFKHCDVELVYGDAEFFAEGHVDQTIRYYKSSALSKKNLSWGQMPAHPSMFFRKEVYRELKGFKIDYEIAADYEFLCRLVMSLDIRSQYVGRSLVRMQLGGLSTSGFKSTLTLNKEVKRSLVENGIYTNYLMILSKYPRKILGFLSR